ncbi:pirin family protein [Falsirhodobacter sp. 20TX0035]|uniref:pirin family protein n=1 Tax=Falsirhodobacter sp. 20TX0035 TaxID=3022019 RepID=UPI00232FB735|nr:pirin-like bicupin family protein [Falsirhodobacter sp. 20TX0035]MDB6453687.1 pirin family protein [Falsirhodobacter sp. 20TX0035]
MILIHENMSRGRTRKGWADAFHTFSFGDFLDPTRMGFARLRVLNEDTIVPGAGFAPHDHADMDILTLVLSGRIRHEDSLGNVAEIAPGEMQLMRAGSGVTHSEMNASDTEPAHVLQIWVIPDRADGEPSYQSAPLAEGLLASRTGPLVLGSNTRITLARPKDGDSTRIEVAPHRAVFVHLVEGMARMEGERLVAGDGLELTETPPTLDWQTDGTILIFDMPQERWT